MYISEKIHVYISICTYRQYAEKNLLQCFDIQNIFIIFVYKNYLCMYVMSNVRNLKI